MQTIKLCSLAIVALLVTVLFAGSVTIIVAAQSTDAQPIEGQTIAAAYPTSMMFRYNTQRTGDYSAVAGFPNGRLKWNAGTGGWVMSSPTVANGVVYVGSNDGYLYAFDATTGAFKWKYETGGSEASPAVANGIVYVGGYGFFALDAMTGKLLWSKETQWVYSSPAVAYGQVYVGFGYPNHGVYAFDATTGAFKWKYETGNDVESSPAVVNGVVYVGSNDGNLYALNAATGAKKLQFPTGVVKSSPAVAGGVVYVTSENGHVYAFNTETGVKKWDYNTIGGSSGSSPAVAYGKVYVTSGYGMVYALSATTGKPQWSYQTGGWALQSSPAVANGVVYFGDWLTTPELCALDATTGKVKWTYPLGDVASSSPAIANGIVYIGCWDNLLYAIGNQPTTFNLMPASQSAQPNAKVQITGYLRTGATGIGGQHVDLWAQSGTGSWSKVGTGTTGTGTSAGYVTFNVGATGQVAQTNQYYLMFQGAGAYATAKSNIITIKFETTKTTPYQTALSAYAPKQVVTKGTTNTMYAKLQSGATPLTNQYVFIWKYSGGKFVIVSRVITRTASQSPGAGWAQADYRWNSVGTGMYKFVYYGTSPSGTTSYARSESNAVQLIWT